VYTVPTLSGRFFYQALLSAGSLVTFGLILFKSMINHNAVNPKDLPGTARTILLIDWPNTDVLRASLKER
jgi:hypothetical protein